MTKTFDGTNQYRITEVVARAQRGDREMITMLYERYQTNIFRYLFYKTGDEQVTEYLTADVFLKMLNSLKSYKKQKTDFDAWLFQIARNLAIDYYRKTRIRNHVPLSGDLRSERDNVEKTVDANLTSERLTKASNQLKDAQREVIILRFVNELPIAVVSRLLHKSEDSV